MMTFSHGPLQPAFTTTSSPVLYMIIYQQLGVDGCFRHCSTCTKRVLCPFCHLFHLKVLAENGVDVVHYFNPLDNAIQASCHRRALQRPVPGQDAIVTHPIVQGVLCDKSYRQALKHACMRHRGQLVLTPSRL